MRLDYDIDLYFKQPDLSEIGIKKFERFIERLKTGESSSYSETELKTKLHASIVDYITKFKDGMIIKNLAPYYEEHVRLRQLFSLYKDLNIELKLSPDHKIEKLLSNEEFKMHYDSFIDECNCLRESKLSQQDTDSAFALYYGIFIKLETVYKLYHFRLVMGQLTVHDSKEMLALLNTALDVHSQLISEHGLPQKLLSESKYTRIINFRDYIKALTIDRSDRELLEILKELPVVPEHIPQQKPSQRIHDQTGRSSPLSSSDTVSTVEIGVKSDGDSASGAVSEPDEISPGGTPRPGGGSGSSDSGSPTT